MKINRIFEIASDMYFNEDADSVKVILEDGDFFIEVFGGIESKQHDVQVCHVNP